MRIKYEYLKKSNLYRNAFYLTDRENEKNNDPLSQMFDCEDNGVFRYVGGSNLDPVNIALLCYKKNEPEFSKNIDERSGLDFLRICFRNAESSHRESIPPFFVFTTGISGPRGLDLLFRGVVIPGDQGQLVDRETHLIWSSKNVEKYLHKKPTFTVLHIDEVSRSWINDLINGDPLSDNCPEVWRKWVETGECIKHKESKIKRFLRYLTGSTGFGDHIGRD